MVDNVENRWREFAAGAKTALPVVTTILPFGILFGALAISNGVSVGETVLLSALIFAGASQMVGLELFGQNVAPWLIVLSIFAVNFRHVLYSAAIGRKITHWGPAKMAFGLFFLTDPQFAEAEKRHAAGIPVTFVWYCGMALSLYVTFVLLTWAGVVFGLLISNPQSLGLDFLVPIYFLALVMAFRTRSLWFPVVAASSIASILAYETIGSPWHVSLGAIAGVVVAVIAPQKQASNDHG